MTSALARRLFPLIPLALLAACNTETSNERVLGIQAMSFANSEWSEPVNLAAINTGAADAQADLSPDELSLYFQSDRTGDADIWVSHRACRECDWEAPVNLGPVINTTFIENGPALSIDGHLLFFFSNRPGVGGNDIYVSRRTDTHDDFAWGPPEILGADVNTAGDENAPHYQQSAEPGGAKLYFTRGPAGTQGQDLYSAPVTREGETAGPAVFLSELNHPAANDAAPTVRTDGKEIWFHRGAPAGGLGLSDLWVSTRRSANDPWSTPENPGAPLNSAAFDQQPSLSFDGQTLVWTSNRPGSVLAPNGLPSLSSARVDPSGNTWRTPRSWPRSPGCPRGTPCTSPRGRVSFPRTRAPP